MSSNLFIRKLSMWDWPVVAELFSRTLPRTSAEDRAFALKAFTDFGQLAVIDHRIVGFSIMSGHRRTGVAWLDYLGVDKNFRNKGVGKRLLECFEAGAAKRGDEWVALSTFLDDETAQSFYRKNQYQERPDTTPGKILFFKSLRNNGKPFLLPELIPYRQGVVPRILKSIMFRLMVARGSRLR